MRAGHRPPPKPYVQFSRIRRSDSLHALACTGALSYLITLLPVIGLVQVGAQAHADRYTYVPMVGLSIALVWGVAEALDP